MQGTVKEIKRAYARELKLIDLEKNPEAFQKLREAYEAALKNAHLAEPAPVPESLPEQPPMPMPAAAPEPIRVDPQPQAAALPPPVAVQDLIAQLERSIAGIARGRIADDELIWKDEIRHQLEILRPLSLDAQAEFERQVGILLLNGWKHGHEALLVAAAEAFGWSDAGWRWDHLGANGATLDSVLALRHCLEHFAESEHRHFRYVIRDLRQQYEPTKEALSRDLPYATFLEKHFAPLLSVLVPPGRIDAWRQAYRKPEPTMKFRYRFAIMAALLTVFYALKAINSSPYQDQPKAPSLPPPPAEAVDRSIEPQELTPAQRQMILNQLYGDAWHATSPAKYDVILDSIGRPHEVTLLQSSGVTSDDFALDVAIRRIARYPADFPRRFTFVR